MLSRPITQWLHVGGAYNTTAAEISEGSPIDRNFRLILLFIGLLIISKRTDKLLQILKRNVWVLILFIYSLISIFWSDYPFVAFKRIIKSLTTLVMILVILTEENPLESMKTILRRCAYIYIPLSIVFIKSFWHLGVRYDLWGGMQFVGVSVNKNTLGRACFVFALYFLFEIFILLKKRKTGLKTDKQKIFIYIIYLLQITWLLLKVDSMTSNGCLFIGILTFFIMGISLIKKNPSLTEIYIFTLVTMILISQFVFDITGKFISGSGHGDTFVGRTKLWKVLLEMKTNPLIGTGYGSFWIGERLHLLWEKYWWQPNEAHNGLLDVYLNLGLIGIFIWLMILLNTYLNIKKTLFIDFYLGRFQLSFLVIIFFYNVTEAAVTLSSSLIYIFMFITLCPPNETSNILNDSIN